MLPKVEKYKSNSCHDAVRRVEIATTALSLWQISLSVQGEKQFFYVVKTLLEALN